MARKWLVQPLKPKCPECGGERTWKAGYYRERQRRLCRDCGYRFSEPEIKLHITGKPREVSYHISDSPDVHAGDLLSSQETLDDFSLPFSENISSHISEPQFIPTARKDLSTSFPYSEERQICASEREAENLTEVVKSVKDGLEARQATEQTIETTIKSELVNFVWWMKKQNYADTTIACWNSCLRTLLKRGANLGDVESVKDVIAKQSWSDNRRRNVINAYTLFLKTQGLQWEKPKCKVTRKIPFIPTEKELDALIAGCGKKTSTFLQLLKETAMRSGEAKRIEWVDINFQKNLITLNCPEKGSNPRIWKVSSELINMLNRLPRKEQKIFGTGPINSLKTTFYKARKRLAQKLQNPRLLRISFHTFRHWKATILYHQTKDPYYVKNFLGHRSLRSTEVYITIEQTVFEPTSDEFTVKVVSKPEEIKTLLAIGFEYVCEKDGLVFLRKRK